VGLVEFFERKAFNKYTDASRLFVYKVTRDLLQWTGDTGAYIRSTMGLPRAFWRSA
jgi:C1A family cysteine protease